MVAFNVYIEIQEPLYEQLMGANPRLFALLQRNYGWVCPMVGEIVQWWVGLSNYGWDCPIMGGIVQWWVGWSRWSKPGTGQELLLVSM